MAVAAAGPHSGRRRTWPQRLLIGFNLALILACLLGAGGLAYLYQRFGALPRVTLGPGVLAPKVDEPGDPQNFLLVGSDTREGQDSRFGDVSETGDAKSDTILVVRVDPRAETAAMLSFPRDLLVEINGTDRSNRINTAFAGGPEQLIRTIDDNFGIPIHHYAQVDFKGFKGVVDAVGGVEVYLEGPVRDRDPATGANLSGLDIDARGCFELDGDQALSYVRSRHFQRFVDGEWITDPSGDLGRIQRQQDFIRRALHEALSKDLLNPIRLNALVSVGIDTVTVDRGLGVDDIVELGERFRSLTPTALQQYTLPVENDTLSSGAAVLALVDGPEAESIFDVFRGERASTAGDEEVAPSSVNVRVLNGSGRSGEATQTTEALRAAGFGVVGPGDGEGGTEVTTILYGAGQEAQAALLERHLEAGARLVEAEDGVSGVDVVLVTGLDYTGVLDEPRDADTTPDPERSDPPPSTTTT
ncbi:MAG: LCP family protein, partial [Actinomycetota bacterium]|nr:LCP family protein [Actinomycetota bacterium]